MQCVLLVNISITLVAAKVTENKIHTIIDREMTVELMEPKKPTKTFTDGYSIVINNVSESISEALLYLYIDNFTELDGEEGDYVMKRQHHDHTQLVVTFNSKVDLPKGGEYIITMYGLYTMRGKQLSTTSLTTTMRLYEISYALFMRTAWICTYRRLYKYPNAHTKQSKVFWLWLSSHASHWGTVCYHIL